MDACAVFSEIIHNYRMPTLIVTIRSHCRRYIRNYPNVPTQSPHIFFKPYFTRFLGLFRLFYCNFNYPFILKNPGTFLPGFIVDSIFSLLCLRIPFPLYYISVVLQFFPYSAFNFIHIFFKYKIHDSIYV